MHDNVPLLLIPGLTCSPRLYVHQLPVLWGIAPVMFPNHVRDNTMAAVAARILEEAPPRFAVAGHSMGGYIALEMFRQAPERIARIALLNTSAQREAPEVTEKRRILIDRCRAGEHQAVLSELFVPFVHPERVNDTALRQTIMDMGNDVGVEAFIRQMQAISRRADSRPLLPSIKCPALMLTSSIDDMVKKEFSQELMAGIPHAKFVLVPDCGHMSPVERPDAVTAALVEWLKAE